ncbi:ABC transporter permease [Streptomyces sp. NPDC097727]|uniref:ABC transporter permease n=1 Tax=Streptomyces sp. NPDC097727 TaxID=3366092 RepID=UPI00380FE8B4
MTAAVSVPPVIPSAEVSDGLPPVRFRDLVAAEWIKMRSLRSTPWALGFITVFVIVCAAGASYSDYRNFPGMDPETQQARQFALHDAFPSTGYLSLMLVAGSLGAIAVVSEYSSGMIRTSTVAVPARSSLVMAKVTTVTVLWTVLGTVMTLGSYGVSQLILGARDVWLPLDRPGTVQALVASALLAPVSALIGLGLGFLIRHSAITMVTTTSVLLLLPSFFATNKPWSAAVNHAMPVSAWQGLTQTWGSPAELPADRYAPVAEAWAMYAVWPLIAVVLSLLVVQRRDV